MAKASVATALVLLLAAYGSPAQPWRAENGCATPVTPVQKVYRAGAAGRQALPQNGTGPFPGGAPADLEPACAPRPGTLLILPCRCQCTDSYSTLRPELPFGCVELID